MWATIFHEEEVSFSLLQVKEEMERMIYDNRCVEPTRGTPSARDSSSPPEGCGTVKRHTPHVAMPAQFIGTRDR